MTEPASFASLGLSASALKALDRAGYERPTPVQARCIPPALAGRDVVGCAATGTGKTAAFVLPIVERLAGRHGTRALVLAPTRELAMQIGEHVEMFGRDRGVRGAVIIGGVGMEPQVQALREGREIVIATPGRLNDHLDRKTAKLGSIEVLVLDEADRMLDMGFKPQLERILGWLPVVRQTLLFSATMAGEVATFAGRHLKNPERVEVARSGTVAERAAQRVFHVPAPEKTPLLLALLAQDDASTLVFTRTKHRADALCRAIARAGHDVERIHANRSQGQRRNALAGFKSGEHRVLVATDIAARGLDIEEIGHVVNYDLPHVPEDYVHRVGRTARMAASGRASSFCSPEERPLLADIEKFTRQRVPVEEVPRDSAVFQEELRRRPARPAHEAAPGARTTPQRGSHAAHGGAHASRGPSSPAKPHGARHAPQAHAARRGGGRKPSDRAERAQRILDRIAPSTTGGQKAGSWRPRRGR